MPPYVVFSDATLVAIADQRPDSRAALARISGVGPTKLDRYAEPVLAVLGGADPPTSARSRWGEQVTSRRSSCTNLASPRIDVIELE